MVEAVSSGLPFKEATVQGKGRGLVAGRGLLPGQVDRHGTEQSSHFLFILLILVILLNS